MRGLAMSFSRVAKFHVVPALLWTWRGCSSVAWAAISAVGVIRINPQLVAERLYGWQSHVLSWAVAGVLNVVSVTSHCGLHLKNGCDRMRARTAARCS